MSDNSLSGRVSRRFSRLYQFTSPDAIEDKRLLQKQDPPADQILCIEVVGDSKL